MWGIPEGNEGKAGHTHALIAHVVVDVAPLLKKRGPRKTKGPLQTFKFSLQKWPEGLLVLFWFEEFDQYGSRRFPDGL